MRRRLTAMALVAAGLVAGTTLALSSPAAACTCLSLTDVEASENADVVFTGNLVEVQTPSGDSFSSADPEHFIFDVDRVYKGEARATQSVVTARSGASCGLELSGRGPFLVFAFLEPDRLTGGVEGELHSNLCSGSRALEDHRSVPESFGAGEPPESGESPVGSADDRDSALTPILGGAAALAVLALIAWLALLRRGRAPRTTAT